MSDVHGPIWIINEKEQTYPDGRFDGVQDPPLGVEDMKHFQAEYDERTAAIAEAAAAALDNMTTVLRLWPYGPLDPLTWMKALVKLLNTPA